MEAKSALGRNLLVAATLLAAGFFAAYLRFLPHIQRGEYTDGERTLRLDDERALRFALWDAPAAIDDALASPDDEGRPALSPDGRWLVFAVGDPALDADLWIAEMVGGRPATPRLLERLRTGYADCAPAFGDGVLVFASDRPGGQGGLDLWRAPFADGVVLGPPEPFDASVNSAWDDTDPAPLAEGDALAFASDRPRGRRTDFDLYLAVPREADGWTAVLRDTLRPDALDGDGSETAPGAASDARGAYAVVPLEALNSAFDEREPAFTAGARDVLFASDRAGGAGGFDLLRSLRSFATFTAPEPLVGVDGAGDERGPAPSADGFTLLFARGGDLLRARSRELLRVPGRPVGWLDLTILALLLLLALLTWLGRRWETLDVLARCLLVSLVVHVLLMLWFREVPVENEALALPPPGPTFRVQLAPSIEQRQATTERAGALDLERSAPLADASAPARREPDDASAFAEAAPARPAASGTALALPELAAADAPDARATEAVRATDAAATRGGELTLADAPSARPTHAGEAPALEVVALASDATRGATREAGRPARVVRSDAGRDGAGGDASPPAGAPAPAHDAPLAVPLAVPRLAAGTEAPAPERVVSRPDGAPRAGLAAPALRDGALAEAARDPGGDAPAFEIASLAGVASGGRAERGLARPERRTSDAALAEASGERARPAQGALELDVPRASGGAADAADVPRAAALDARPAPRGALPTVALDDSAGASAGDGAAAADGAPSAVTSSVSRPARDVASAHDDLVGAPAASALQPSSRGRRTEAARPTRAGLLAAAALPAATLARPAAAPELALPVATQPTGPDVPRADADWDHTPYRTRFGEAKALALDEHGGSQQTEEAVTKGLAYLARLQGRNGNWGDGDDFDDKYGHVAVGKTALCLLAFLGAGHTPNAGEHATTVRKAVDFLLAVQDGRTGHFGYTTAYSHGVTTYALAECLALTGDERLRAPLAKAVAWIVRNQDASRDPRRRGGWGYYSPSLRSDDGWPRSSISAWQVMALESARLAGLDVPDETFARAREFLRAAHRPERGVILYSHEPARLSGPYWTLPGSTPAGLFALSLLGEDLAGAEWESCIEWIAQRAPDGYERRPSSDAFVLRAQANLYFWYYGSLVLFRRGGPAWEAWNRALQDTLLPSQRADGSWDSLTLYADYAGDDARDHAYATAMSVLTLEVYYRYFTPLLRVEPR